MATTNEPRIFLDGHFTPESIRQGLAFVDLDGVVGQVELLRENTRWGGQYRSIARGRWIWRVRWNANAGRGWARGWKRDFATREEAAEFAAKKLDDVTAWVVRKAIQAAA